MVATPFGDRRRLVFAALGEVPREVERLALGHRTRGRWSLAQVCRHLADTIAASMDGFDLSRRRLQRRLLGKPLLWATYRYGIPPGFTVDPRLHPPEGAALDETFPALRFAIARYEQYSSALQPHPLFGRLSRAGWDRLHCFHCAHHLSFIEPPPPP